MHRCVWEGKLWRGIPESNWFHDFQRVRYGQYTNPLKWLRQQDFNLQALNAEVSETSEFSNSSIPQKINDEQKLDNIFPLIDYIRIRTGAQPLLFIKLAPVDSFGESIN